jgi:DHA3 family macrolide efflux protein-like MFS transporter
MDSSGWKARFFIVWTGQAFSLVGSALVSFALIWWLTANTGSATTLATAALMSWLPVIVLGPFAGALIDRWSRQWIMVVADGMTALFTALLVYLYWLGTVQVWHVYVILFLRSLGTAFHEPAMMAATPLMAPRDQLTRIAGLNKTLDGGITIVCPPLGALLLAVLPIQSILAIDVLTAVIAIVPLLVVDVPQPETIGTVPGQRSVIGDLIEEFRYVWNWRGLCLLVVTAAVARLFVFPAYHFIPLLVTKHFGGDAVQLGWMNSAQGVGTMAGGIILSAWGGFRRRMVTSLVGAIGIGVGFVILGVAPSTVFWLALAAICFVGISAPIMGGPRIAILQSSVPPEMQGRVLTLYRGLLQAMIPLGLAIGGPLADAFDVRLLFILGGTACILAGLTYALVPSILYLEDGSR